MKITKSIYQRLLDNLYFIAHNTTDEKSSSCLFASTFYMDALRDMGVVSEVEAARYYKLQQAARRYYKGKDYIVTPLK